MSNNRKATGIPNTRDKRERAFRELLDSTPDATVIYHTRHSCGHAVYWDSLAKAYMWGEYPCPWCGGANGTLDIPDYLPVIHQPGTDRDHVRKDPTALCGCESGRTIISKHRADDSCCQGAGSIN